jgi:hypothetical protein
VFLPSPHERELFDAEKIPPLPSDEDDDTPQNSVAPERRQSRPRKRPDPLHYVKKAYKEKKQDYNN